GRGRGRDRDRGARQAGGCHRDRRRSAGRHRGDAARDSRHEGWRGLQRIGAEERAMTAMTNGQAVRGLTRRDWLKTTGALLAGSGLATPAAAPPQPKRGGTLRVATVDKPVNMDPGYAQLYSSLQVYQNVYNKLVYVDDKGQFLPGLARSWKQESDKTWVFDLVDNAVFHNGEPMT